MLLAASQTHACAPHPPLHMLSSGAFNVLSKLCTIEAAALLLTC